MTAHARIQLRAPRPVETPRPALREVPPLAPVSNPRARTVALYGTGLVAGFLLAGVATAPGGGALVMGQLALAAISAVVAGVAWLIVFRGDRASSPETPTDRPVREAARSATVAPWPTTDLTTRRRSSERSM